MGEDLQFQRCWEFRRKDSELDSSSDNSKAIFEPLLKKHKLVSGLISLDDDETSGTSRLMQDNVNQETTLPSKPGKAKTKRRRNQNVGELQGDCLEEVSPQRGKPRAHDAAAAVENAKMLMESLFDDLKVATENLFTWMRDEMHKLFEDHSGSCQTRRTCPNGREKGQLKRQKRFTMNTEGKLKKPLKEPVQVQKEENLQEKQVHMEHESHLRYGMRTQNCDHQSSDNLVKSSNATDASNYYNSMKAQIDNGQANEPMGSREQEKGKKIPLFANSKSQTSPIVSDQNIQLQTQKTVVLAIEAQNCNNERTARRKKVVDRDDHCQATDKQVIRASTSCGNINRKIPETSPEQSFLSNPAHLPTSSVFPTSATFLIEPQASVRRHDASPGNNVLPGEAEKKTGFFLERANQMLDLSALRGYFPRLQAEERLGSFGLPKSRNVVSFNQIAGSSSNMGPGFLVPHRPGMDVGCSIPSQVNQGGLMGKNGNTMGLTMNGGAIQFSGGNYSLSEHFVASHHHSNLHSGYNPPEGRLTSYQIPKIRESPHFSK